MVNTMMRRNTRILNWMTQLLDQTKDIKDTILFALDKLKTSDDVKITNNITEIKLKLYR